MPLNIDYSKIPGSAVMQAGVMRYLENGRPPGHFLTAIICNDLSKAVAYGDLENQALLVDWVKFFYNEAPGNSWGNPKIMNAWLNSFDKDGNKIAPVEDDRGNEP